jgi:hypothetical protein
MRRQENYIILINIKGPARLRHWSKEVKLSPPYGSDFMQPLTLMALTLLLNLLSKHP